MNDKMGVCSLVKGFVEVLLDCIELLIGGDVRDRTAVLKLVFYDIYMLREVV